MSATPILKPHENIILVRKHLSELPRSIQEKKLTLLGGLVDDTNKIAHQEAGDDGNPVAIYINPHQDDETLSMGAQLVKDVLASKDVYIMQMTRGNLTRAHSLINEKLEVEGYPLITTEELCHSRTREMKAGLLSIGVPEDHVIEYPYLKRELTPSIVFEELVDFIERFPNRPIQGFDALYPSDQGYTLWTSMMDHYGVWDPAEGRYAVGHHSIKKAFDIIREKGYCYFKRAM